MKILYLTMAEVDETSGVYKKIIAQSEAFERLGNECSVLFLNNQEKVIYKQGESFSNAIFNDELIDEIVRSKFDVCYARFELLRHKNYKKMIDICRCNQIDIIVEIPTYPPYQESIARVREKIQKKDILGGIRTLVGSVAVVFDMYRLVYYSKMMCLIADDKQFVWRKTVRIENGIDISKNPFVFHERRNNINIIAVSNFAIWNGYDRAIMGLYNYYKETGKNDIHLTMVGDLSKAQSMIDQVEQLNISKLVTFTGSLSGAALNSAYANADIALGALGNHRRKVFQNSSLKAKEYAARGMLMILSDAEGIEEEILSKSFVVKSDESPIDYCSVINWFNKVNEHKEICTEIHEFSRNNYSWDVQMKSVIDSYLELEK